tara:strand:+ start:948 stop:2648 length:1701 start_codon:yes stop_codon:yes gene_type:complete
LITPEAFKYRAETDTGFFARHICGYNYDQHHLTGEIVNRGSGGVRAEGPHLQMTTFLDSTESRTKHMEAPRGSLKTSMLEALVMRTMLRDPNARILYGMEVNEVAKQSLARIKKIFEGSEKIKDLWGDVRGPVWNNSALTLSGVSLDKADKEPGLCTFGVDKTRVGGHYSMIIADDLVNQDNVKNKEGIEKVLQCFKSLFFLLDPGGILIVCGTRYHDDDLYGHILGNLQEEFDTLILDCGMQLERSESGKVELVGGPPTFAHLNEDFLRFQFNQLKDPGYFSSQYLNQCLSSDQMLFFREQFVSVRWENWMKDLSTYLIVDTATSEKDEGCYSAGVLIGLDSKDDAYVLDCFVGHLNPMEVVGNILDMHERWESRSPIRKTLFEKIGLNATFKAMVLAESKARQTRVNMVDVPRGSGQDSKKQRIAKLQQRFSRGTISFVDTIPRVFTDIGETKKLYDPEGYTGESGDVLPDGEMVLEFIRFPSYGKNDIADAIADIDVLDSKGYRICSPGNVQRERRRRDSRRRRGTVIPVERLVNGRKQLVDVLPSREHTANGSWISQYKGRR